MWICEQWWTLPGEMFVQQCHKFVTCPRVWRNRKLLKHIYGLCSIFKCTYSHLFCILRDVLKTSAYQPRETLPVPTLWISPNISSLAAVLLECHSADSIEFIHLLRVRNMFKLLMNRHAASDSREDSPPFPGEPSHSGISGAAHTCVLIAAKEANKSLIIPAYCQCQLRPRFPRSGGSPSCGALESEVRLMMDFREKAF